MGIEAKEETTGIIGFAGDDERSHLMARLRCSACDLSIPEPKSYLDFILLKEYALNKYNKQSIDDLPPIQIGMLNTESG